MLLLFELIKYYTTVQILYYYYLIIYNDNIQFLLLPDCICSRLK